MIHLLILALIVNIFKCDLVPHKLPADLMPTGAPLNKSLTGQIALVIGGLHGIAKHVAQRLHANGATVIITTRSLKKNKEEVRKVPYHVMEFEFGLGHKNVQKFFKRFYKKFTHINLYHDIGLTYYTGLMFDFTPEENEYAIRMYITDPLAAIRAILHANPPAKLLNLTIGISTVSFGTLSSFYSMYGAGKVMKKDMIRDFQLYEQPKKYPNVRMSGIACGFVNTRIMVDGYHPSALRGDRFMKDYLATVTEMCKVGSDPDTIAQAHVEAATLLVPTNNSIYLALSRERTSVDVFYNIYVNDFTQQYKTDNYAVYKSLGLDIPTYI